MRVVVVLLIFAALFAVVTLIRSRQVPEVTDTPMVKMRDIPAVFDALSAGKRDGAFAVFLFGPRGQPPAAVDALNVQFSIEGGVVGIDWVLLAPVNLEVQPRFVTFFERKGCTVVHREVNAVRYLRVQADHPAELLQEFLREDFGVSSDQGMQLIADGFIWRSAR